MNLFFIFQVHYTSGFLRANKSMIKFNNMNTDICFGNETHLSKMMSVVSHSLS